MFTGIIGGLGTVIKLDRMSGTGLLVLECDDMYDRLEKGSSLAVNGTCLTLTNKRADRMYFDLSRETLTNTNLSGLRSGDIVNLELPLSAEGRFDGHIVQGHIDGVGKIMDLTKASGETLLKVRVPEHLSQYIVEKGSIAIDGISLTISRIEGNDCLFSIIPFTMKNTNLQYLNKGSKVNIEVDIIGKYIKSFLEKDINITKDLLRDYGF
jgi:riboflavin synthase